MYKIAWKTINICVLSIKYKGNDKFLSFYFCFVFCTSYNTQIKCWLFPKKTIKLNVLFHFLLSYPAAPSQKRAAKRHCSRSTTNGSPTTRVPSGHIVVEAVEVDDIREMDDEIIIVIEEGEAEEEEAITDQSGLEENSPCWVAPRQNLRKSHEVVRVRMRHCCQIRQRMRQRMMKIMTRAKYPEKYLFSFILSF